METESEDDAYGMHFSDSEKEMARGVDDGFEPMKNCQVMKIQMMVSMNRR